jgi:hypothetical protein
LSFVVVVVVVVEVVVAEKSKGFLLYMACAKYKIFNKNKSSNVHLLCINTLSKAGM